MSPAGRRNVHNCPRCRSGRVITYYHYDGDHDPDTLWCLDCDNTFAPGDCVS